MFYICFFTILLKNVEVKDKLWAKNSKKGLYFRNIIGFGRLKIIIFEYNFVGMLTKVYIFEI